MRKITLFTFALLPVLAAIFFCPPAHADIKIIDSRGLTRAVRHLGGKGTVEAIVKRKGGERAAVAATLTNIDGLAPDIQGTPENTGIVRFTDVADGTWRLSFSEPKIIVEEVKISSPAKP